MSLAPSLTFPALAVLTGTIAAAPPEPAAPPPVEQHAPAAADGAPDVSGHPTATFGAKDDGGLPDQGCLSRTICSIKEKIRWQTSAWTPGQCQKIAAAVLSSARRHRLGVPLLLAVMINESDLNEKAVRVSLRGKKVYAKDTGLMAIRCVLGRNDRCLNAYVRGLAWADLMKPETNIELGAEQLAHWRDGGAVTRTFVKRRDENGRVRPILKSVHCRHKDHAWWAHYNHGPHYIGHGYPRHYPHRVAVLDHALANVLHVDAPELHGARITMRDPGKPDRRVDQPREARYRKLCDQIQSVQACTAVALND